MEERKRRGSEQPENEVRPHKIAKKEKGEDKHSIEDSPFNLLPVEITVVILLGGVPVWNRLSTTLGAEALAMCFICRFVCRQWRDLLPLPPLPTISDAYGLDREAKKKGISSL